MVNAGTSRWNPFANRWCATMLVFAASALRIDPAAAEVDLSAVGSVGVSRISNPNELAAGDLVPGSNSKRADTSTDLSVGFNAQTGSAPNLLRLSAKAEKIEYQRFDALNHWEYTVAANLDWKPADAFDTSVLLSREQTPAQLADVGGDEAALQTKSVAQVTLRIRPNPQWQVLLTPGWLFNELPLPDVPDFRFREVNAGVALDYLGAGRVVPGLGYDLVRGKYFGIEDATRYRQQTFKATAKYKATGFSTFTLTAGYTLRSTHLVEPSNDPEAQDLEGGNSAFTGELFYDRALSVKTSVYVGVFRNFEHYDAGVNSAVGTGYSLGANWAPTTKLALALEHRRTWTDIDGLGVGTGVATRKDVLSTYSVALLYHVTRALSLRPNYTRRIRTSNAAASQYNNTVIGLELSGTLD
jgi:hypothetical protein